MLIEHFESDYCPKVALAAIYRVSETPQVTDIVFRFDYYHKLSSFYLNLIKIQFISLSGQ